jgi:thiamine-phosphate pyrophosphorylase
VGLIQQVRERVATPFFAIGGITQENVAQVLEAGATRIAVVSAILSAPDVAATVRAFKARLAG